MATTCPGGRGKPLWPTSSRTGFTVTATAGLGSHLGLTWRTVRRSIKLPSMPWPPSRHGSRTSPPKASKSTSGTKELTWMVDITPDQQGRVHAHMRDLVPGCWGKAYADWPYERGKPFAHRRASRRSRHVPRRQDSDRRQTSGRRRCPERLPHRQARHHSAIDERRRRIQ